MGSSSAATPFQLSVLGSLTIRHDAFTRRASEYHFALVVSLLGMSVLASARELVLLFVAFELMSMPLFLLTGFLKRDAVAPEAAMKFFLVGTASSAAKCKAILGAGAKHAINTSRQDVTKAVMRITKNRGVDAIYDPVGKDTWEGSLDCLQPRGVMVSFGASSGTPADFSINQLQFKGSLYATRPTLLHYVASREDLLDSANALFAAVDKGLKVEINQTFALKDTAEAHRALLEAIEDDEPGIEVTFG